MANKKISEMTYKTLALDDQIPTVNSSSPGENFYALAADIPLAVGVSQWNSFATYLAGHVIIYNGATTKGLFMVNSTTSAGDAPDGVAFAKFKSLGAGFISTNTFTTADTSPSNINWTIDKERTGRCVFANGVACTGTSSVPQLVYCFINTGFIDGFLDTCKFNITISTTYGQSPLMAVRNAVVFDGTSGVIQVIVAVYATGSIYLNSRHLDFEIVG